MTSITNILNSASYQLSSQKNEEAVTAEDTKNQAVTDKVEGSGLGGAYNLDLSPEAMAYLKSLEEQTLPEQEESKDYGYSLTEDEKAELADIIAKYKELPYTQENFDKLQAELKSVRLDPLNLAAKDMMRTFNVTTSLLDALNGTATMISASDRLKGQESKSGVFIEQVASDWYNQIMLSDV